jgi:hypothetical protein
MNIGELRDHLTKLIDDGLDKNTPIKICSPYGYEEVEHIPFVVDDDRKRMDDFIALG